MTIEVRDTKIVTSEGKVIKLGDFSIVIALDKSLKSLQNIFFKNLF